MSNYYYIPEERIIPLYVIERISYNIQLYMTKYVITRYILHIIYYNILLHSYRKSISVFLNILFV